MHLFAWMIFVAAQTGASAQVDLLPLGELDGPRLRQMGRQLCGPYFSAIPTGQGGAFITFGYTSIEGEQRVASFISGMIRPQICKDCQRPTATRHITESGEEWVDLFISRKDLDMAPCLKHLKTNKK